jgi:hypothetical protein
METIVRKRVGRGALAVLVVTALVVTAAFGFGFALPSAQADAATPSPYPWSERSGATLDYLDDVYTGLSSGHVFEDVTAERLYDILSSKGDYYILFGGPQNASTQKIIGDIDKTARSKGITKIYHFNPLVDGYQLDVTKTTGVGTWEGGNKGRVPGGDNTPISSLHAIWTDVLDLLPAGVDAQIKNYDSKDTVLFHFTKKAATDLPSATTVATPYTFKASAASSYKAGADSSAIGAVFTTKSSVRSDYEFFKRVYNGNATFFNRNLNVTTGVAQGATGNRTGATSTQLFKDSDFKNGAGFKLHQVTAPELWNILNAPGEHAILFASAPCHNTQAIVAEVAKAAKSQKYNGIVYVYDPSLGGSTVWGKGSQINTVLSNAATGGLYTRNSNYNFGYIYAYIVKYFKTFITENNTKKENRIHFYPNGNIAAKKTTADPWDTSAAASAKGAIRLQVPFLLSYDKSARKPAVKQWIHKKKANDGTYSEYMLDYAFVLGTSLAKALPITAGSAGADSVDTDGKQAVAFAKEAVAALKPVLAPVNPWVTKLRAAQTKIYLTKGKTHKPAVVAETFLGALATPIKGTITYKSSKPKVASVDKNTGKIKALKAGKTTVTATAASGKKIKLTVTVLKKAVKLTKVTVTKKKTLAVGKTWNVAPKYTAKATNVKVTYKSSKPSVASVDAAGRVTALKAGKAVITVKVGSKSAKATVTVK